VQILICSQTVNVNNISKYGVTTYNVLQIWILVFARVRLQSLFFCSHSLSQCLVVFPWVVTWGHHSHGVFHIWLHFPAFCLSLISSLHSAVSHHIVRSVCIYSLSVSVFVMESSLDVLTFLVGFLSVHVLFLVLDCFDYLDLTHACLADYVFRLNLAAIGFSVVLCVIVTIRWFHAASILKLKAGLRWEESWKYR